MQYAVASFSDLEIALWAIAIQNRAEVRKWAVGRGPESGDLQRSALDDPFAEGVQRARTIMTGYRRSTTSSTMKIGFRFTVVLQPVPQ